MVNVSALGAKLRRLRGDRTLHLVSVEISQQQGIQISPVTIGLYEKGSIPEPSIVKLFALARYHGTDLPELLGSVRPQQESV